MAVVVKFADNIVKGFAMSISIIISSIVAFLFFDFSPSLMWLAGAAVVTAATFLYQQPDRPSTSQKPLPLQKNNV